MISLREVGETFGERDRERGLVRRTFLFATKWKMYLSNRLIGKQ